MLMLMLQHGVLRSSAGSMQLSTGRGIYQQQQVPDAHGRSVSTQESQARA